MRDHAHQLEDRFKIKCSEYSKFQINRDIENEEYLTLSKKLALMFLEIYFISVAENWFWDFCSLKTFKYRVKDNLVNTLNSDGNKVDNEKKYFDNLLKLLEKKPFHDTSNLLKDEELIKIGAYKYYYISDAEYIVVDFLSNDVNRIIRNIENEKIIFIEELICQGAEGFSLKESSTTTNNNGNNNNELKLNLNGEFQKEDFDMFKDKYYFELFKYLDKNLVTQYYKSKYSDIYHFLANELNFIFKESQEYYIKMINKRKGFTMSKVVVNKIEHKFKKTLREMNKLKEDFDESNNTTE